MEKYRTRGGNEGDCEGEKRKTKVEVEEEEGT